MTRLIALLFFQTRERVKEQEIINRIKSGDTSAIQPIYQKYRNRLVGYLYNKTADIQLSEDLVQDVFIKFLNRIDQYDHNDRLEAYLYRITHNIFIDHYRKQKSIPIDDYENMITEDHYLDRIIEHPDPDPEQKLIDQQNYSIVLEAIDSIDNEDQKHTLIMYYFYDFTFQDIADIEGVSVNTVLGRARYAREKLEVKLKIQDY